jgi:hypothetical protein
MENLEKLVTLIGGVGAGLVNYYLLGGQYIINHPSLQVREAGIVTLVASIAIGASVSLVGYCGYKSCESALKYP